MMKPRISIFEHFDLLPFLKNSAKVGASTKEKVQDVRCSTFYNGIESEGKPPVEPTGWFKMSNDERLTASQ